MDDARHQATAWRLLSRTVRTSNGGVTLATAGSVCADDLRADALGITLISAGELRLLACATDDLALRLENVQLVTGEGPCTEAVMRQDLVEEADLSQVSGRWPTFSQEATRLGVRSVVALPLTVGQTCVGTVDAYHRRPHALSELQREKIRAWSRVLAQIALDEHPHMLGIEARIPRPGPQGYPVAVHQAAGILAARKNSTLDNALARLRAHAYSNDIPLGEAAQQVIDGHALPGDLDSA